MIRILSVAFICTLFISCDTTEAPKSISKDFVGALYSLDYEKASALSTSETRSIISGKEVEPMNSERKVTEVNKMFLLDSLTEKVDGDKAQVENDMLALNLAKENGEWKVVATKELVDNIINQSEKLTALQMRWNSLHQAYENRKQNAMNYLQFRKQSAPLSEDAQVLDKVLSEAELKEGFNKSDIQKYLQKQNEITTLLEKTLQPSQNASADMSASYIIQINSSENNIATAKKEYNELAQSVRSGIYPPIQ